jgi:hypothetical protein
MTHQINPVVIKYFIIKIYSVYHELINVRGLKNNPLTKWQSSGVIHLIQIPYHKLFLSLSQREFVSEGKQEIGATLLGCG